MGRSVPTVAAKVEEKSHLREVEAIGAHIDELGGYTTSDNQPEQIQSASWSSNCRPVMRAIEASRFGSDVNVCYVK